MYICVCLCVYVLERMIIEMVLFHVCSLYTNVARGLGLETVEFLINKYSRTTQERLRRIILEGLVLGN